jgi:hypothetical protein
MGMHLLVYGNVRLCTHIHMKCTYAYNKPYIYVYLQILYLGLSAAISCTVLNLHFLSLCPFMADALFSSVCQSITMGLCTVLYVAVRLVMSYTILAPFSLTYVVPSLSAGKCPAASHLFLWPGALTFALSLVSLPCHLSHCFAPFLFVPVAVSLFWYLSL